MGRLQPSSLATTVRVHSSEPPFINGYLAVWPETWPGDLVSRCARSGRGDEERRERMDMRDRAPQEPRPEMACMGAKGPAEVFGRTARAASG